MRKADLVQRMTAATGCTHGQATEAVEAILATLKQALQEGDAVVLRRFGTFTVRAKRARMGRNPRTGDAAAIAARRVVRFTAGQALKQRVVGAGTSVDCARCACP
jgi:integration host factor subunit alpha